jgi:choline transport protein
MSMIHRRKISTERLTLINLGDEVKNVETRVPYSIVSTVISNATLLFAFVICLLYSIGDIETVLGDTTGLPIIQVYYQATKSKAWTNVLVVMLGLMMFFCLCNTLASVSRLTWAFARSRGLPFSDFFTVVSITEFYNISFLRPRHITVISPTLTL